MKAIFIGILTLGSILLFAGENLFADTPHVINYQGQLTDNSGEPLDTTVSLTFAIYDDSTDGSSLWSEPHAAVEVEAGIFSVILGETVAINDSVFSGENRWLEINVGGEIITPRTRLTSVPYSHRVSTVDGAAAGSIYGTLNVSADNEGARGPGNVQVGGPPSVTNNAGFIDIYDDAGNVAIMLDARLGTDGRAIIGLGHWGSGYLSFVAGSFNSASGDFSTIGGGALNEAQDLFATVAGGDSNFVILGADHGTIGGGQGNYVYGSASFIGGGTFNLMSGQSSTIGGGMYNEIPADYAAISGGYNNQAGLQVGSIILGNYTAVGGGDNNQASGDYSTIGGGQLNESNNQFSTIGGGYDCETGGDYSSVGGGIYNLANGGYSTIAGGDSNTASGTGSTVAGGFKNNASYIYATVGGGQHNTASTLNCTVGGGAINKASGNCATVPGGYADTASGHFSFAAGSKAKASDSCSFVWADCCDYPLNPGFSSQGDFTFNVRAVGGVYIYSSCDLSTGVVLQPGWTNWQPIGPSDSTLKNVYAEVNGDEILRKLADLEINNWSYKSQDPSVQHIGPMAQDFYRLFGLGDNEKVLPIIDVGGIALAAIQELDRKTMELDQKTAEIDELRQRVEQLQQMVEKLISEAQ
jgi:hypothetical protein